MSSDEIEIRHGIPEEMRGQAASLYDSAFGEKFSLAVGNKEDRISLLHSGFLLEHSFAATQNGRLMGLAGFHSSHGAFTGDISYQNLLSGLGFFRGHWAALVFTLYERKTSAGQLLMDGIAVDPECRGKGIGTKLLGALRDYAKNEGYKTVRLDVIDTNSAARRLYERNGFKATKTENFGYLRWLLGFGASTWMECSLEIPSKNVEAVQS